jgi:hypothetical protein
MIGKQEFALFIAEKGDLYPYNEIRRTRNGIYPRWILFCAKSPQALFCHNGIHLLPTATLSNELIQEIIVREDGIPLPNDYNDIAYCMEHWGRGIDGRWYQDVLHLMESFLREPEGLTRCQLYYDCIYLIVERKLRMVFLHHDVVCAAMSAFENWFHKMFRNGNTDFYHLAVANIQYADSVRAWNSF